MFRRKVLLLTMIVIANFLFIGVHNHHVPVAITGNENEATEHNNTHSDGEQQEQIAWKEPMDTCKQELPSEPMDVADVAELSDDL